MGFSRGSKKGAPERRNHRWINNPNHAHRKCTKCGCTVDMVNINYALTYVYKDKYGTELTECPNCII